jgi:hypothetical protein
VFRIAVPPAIISIPVHNPAEEPLIEAGRLLIMVVSFDLIIPKTEIVISEVISIIVFGLIVRVTPWLIITSSFNE